MEPCSICSISPIVKLIAERSELLSRPTFLDLGGDTGGYLDMSSPFQELSEY